MNALDICAGSGIGSWVWKRLGGRTVCYVENDDYCQRLLQARMADGLICDAPIWDDLRSFDGRPWRGRVDFIFGGIPCQPWSVAGQQQGEADERDLWPDTRRIICEIRPRFVLVENVPGLLVGGMGRVLGELAESGYDAEWDCIPACAVGAPHRRDRVWLVAYPSSAGTRLETYRGGGQGRESADAPKPKILRQGDGAGSAAGIDATSQDVAYPQGGQAFQRDGGELPQEICRGQAVNAAASTSGKDVADADNSNGKGSRGVRPEDTILREAGVGADHYQTSIAEEWADWWQTEPSVGRVADGIPRRVDRLKVLGNGWVPQVAEIVMRRIKQHILQN